MSIASKLGPIEVWLSQPNMTITCKVVYENESTTDYDVESLSMRGAQREMTGFFLQQGYKAAGRWEYEDGEGRECVRRFRPTA